MAITIPQEEINMLQILTNNSQTLSNVLNQSLAARKAAIILLENKYSAIFNEQTGLFERLNTDK